MSDTSATHQAISPKAIRNMPLVGEQHQQLAQELTQEAKNKGASFRVHILSGPSGSGKSRIIRETYNTLVSQQSQPPYWPKLAENPLELLASRKVLGPGRQAHSWRQAALPDFVWWDIACKLSDDLNPSDAINEFAPFLALHVTPVMLADSSGDLRTDARKHLRTKWQELASDTAVKSAGELGMRFLEVISGLDFLGVDTVRERLTASYRWVEEWRDRERQLMSEVVIDVNRQLLAERQVGLLENMATSGLPIIIAIEDLHFMGEDTRAFLEELRRRESKVLVLATAWPEGGQREVFRDWLRSAKKVVTVHQVHEPKADASALMVRHIARNTSPDEARKIAEHWSNPFALLSVLTMRRILESLEGMRGALKFDEDLKDIPHAVEDLYRQRLDEAPEEVADVLALSAGALPPALLTTVTSDFLCAVVAKACTETGEADNMEVVVEALTRAASEYYWCDDQGAGVTVFREPALQVAAHGRLKEKKGPRDRKNLQDVVIKQLEEFIDTQRNGGLLVSFSDPVTLTACSWLIDMKRAHHG